MTKAVNGSSLCYAFQRAFEGIVHIPLETVEGDKKKKSDARRDAFSAMLEILNAALDSSLTGISIKNAESLFNGILDARHGITEFYSFETFGSAMHKLWEVCSQSKKD